jgi:Holliday junction DNA helicase RuvB
MAHLITKQLGVQIKVVTAYAISKPSEIVSLLNSLENGDILFIDEIHRLKPTVEEVLYIAMEDFVIDMVMPEG